MGNEQCSNSQRPDRPEADHDHNLADLQIWRHEFEVDVTGVPLSKGGASNVLVADDRVIFSCFSPGRIAAVSLADGQPLWQTDLAYYGPASMVAAEGRLFADDGQVVLCLEPADGSIIWEWCPYGRDGEFFYSAVAIDGSHLYIGDTQGRFNCLDATSGEVL